MAKKKKITEASELPKGDAVVEDQVEAEHPAPAKEFTPVKDDESDVVRPQLGGERKQKKFEHPGTNNQSRVIHDEEPKSE